MIWLQTFLNWLSLGWVGSVFGIAGVIAAFITYGWTRQRSILAYQKSDSRLLGGSTPELPTEVTIFYRGHEISALSRSTVVLWNAGEKSIAGDDLETTDPLRIEVTEQCKILSVSILGVSRPVIQLACSPSEDSSKAQIRFEFLDRHDGAIIEVLHTDREGSLVVVGTVRGIPKGLTSLGANHALPTQSLRHIRIAGFSLLAIGIGVTAMANLLSVETLVWPLEVKNTAGESWLRITNMAAGILLVLAAFLLLYPSRRRYPKSLAKLND
jgi:hypothetical protein